MATRLKLALALGALTLLPATAAQAAKVTPGAGGPASAAKSTDFPARFTDATLHATCMSGTGDYACVPGQPYHGGNGIAIHVQESCNGTNGALSSLPGGIAPSGLRDDGDYHGGVSGPEDSGAGVILYDYTTNATYTYFLQLYPNQPSVTGHMTINQVLGEGPVDEVGDFSVTGSRSVSAPPWPGCDRSAPAKSCKKQGKKSQAQSAKKKKCKKKKKG